MITLTYSQLVLMILITLLAWIVGNALGKSALDFIRYRKTKNQGFMKAEREEITVEIIRQQVKTLDRMWKKLLPEHRKPIAYVLEILR